MKGIILQKQKMYYTYMDLIFNAINNIQTKYNWLITAYECNDYPDDQIPFGKEYVWISGDKLTRIVNENSIQFIWGVFSAFEKDIPLSKVLESKLPYADGNQDFWVDEFSIQHPDAIIEIVPWDSDLVLVMSKENYVIKSFKKTFPLAEDLKEYNKKLI